MPQPQDAAQSMSVDEVPWNFVEWWEQGTARYFAELAAEQGAEARSKSESNDEQQQRRAA